MRLVACKGGEGAPQETNGVKLKMGGSAYEKTGTSKEKVNPQTSSLQTKKRRTVIFSLSVSCWGGGKKKKRRPLWRGGVLKIS